MFAFLSKPATPWVTAAVLLAVAVVGFFLLRSAWRAEGAAANAVAEQRAKDAALSAQLVDQLQSQIRALEARAPGNQICPCHDRLRPFCRPRC